MIASQPARFALFSLALLASILRSNARAESPEEVLKLPPFIVEETQHGPRWRYARFEGFEVLSRCYDARSRALAYSYYRAHRLHAAILPDGLLARFDVPTKLIFYDDNLWPSAVQEAAAALDAVALVPVIRARPAAGAAPPLDAIRAPDPLFSQGISTGIYGRFVERVRPGSTSSSSLAPNFLTDLRLSDDDEVIIFTVAPPASSNDFKTYLRASYVAELLAARTPTLPAWFVAGFLGLYQKLEFAEDTLTLPPFVWVGPKETEAARDDPRATTKQWLPLIDLLSEDAAVHSRRTLAAQQVASAEMELFVRWALDPAGGDRRVAFGRFVDSASATPVTEDLVRRSFGASSAEILAQLAAYFPQALRVAVTWRVPKLEYPPLDFADATPTQNARIRGEWERLEAVYLRAAAPQLEDTYRAKARATFRRAYDRGDDDPQLLAAYGLCELDGGNPLGASRLLRRSVERDVIRPRACLELARLRLAEALAQPDANGHLAPEDAEDIFRLLTRASAQSPQLQATYQLALDVWDHAATPPDAAGLAFLARGPATFPRSAELAVRTAKFYLAAKEREPALALVDTATRLGASDSFLQPLRELHATLTQSAETPTPNAAAHE